MPGGLEFDNSMIGKGQGWAVTNAAQKVDLVASS